MEPKLKNKTSGIIIFYFPNTMSLHKDLLQLVFLELDHGLDMLDFSELNRKSNQIFRQQIKIIHKPETDSEYERKWMENNHHQKHGIYRKWYLNEQLYCERNYHQGKRHGILRAWNENGKIWYKDSYYQGQRHGIQYGWYSSGKISTKSNYHYGTRIEN